MRAHAAKGPGWHRLWLHSYRLGFRWVIREAPTLWSAGRTGWVRLLVPLDPWRYYEMGRTADVPYGGRCLDVSSPKLLTSLLHREGNGSWVGTDLFAKEIEGWRKIDPTLHLEVQDATSLPYADDSFDNVLCVSVLEHVGPDQDRRAVAEMWRVLKPGGTLHLTTDVASAGKDIFVDQPIYGEASARQGGRLLFKHDYSVEEIDDVLSVVPWVEQLREFAVLRNPAQEARFYARAPWSYAYGPLLRFSAPNNVEVSANPDILATKDHGVLFVQLVKPARVAG